MRTMQSVLKRGGMFWDRDLLPVDAYRERYRRMQSAIADAGDDAWLIYGDVERHGSLTYVSNFLPRVRSAVALVPRQGDPSLLVSMGLRDIPACKQLTWIEDVRPFIQLPKPLIALIEERGLGKGKLGLVGTDESMPITEWQAIESGLPDISWSTRAEGISNLRQRKDTFELTAIRRAAVIVETALDETPRLIKAGTAVRAITAELDRQIRRRGAEDVRIMVASGEQAGIALRPPDDRVLAKGDTVMLFIAAEVQRYWAEAARTFVLGPPAPALRELSGRVLETIPVNLPRPRPQLRYAHVTLRSRSASSFLFSNLKS